MRPDSGIERRPALRALGDGGSWLCVEMDCSFLVRRFDEERLAQRGQRLELPQLCIDAGELFLQLGGPLLALRRSTDFDLPVAVHHPFEHRLHRVVIGLWDGVELVRVTPRTPDRQTQKH